MKAWTILILSLVLISAIASAVENKGREQIDIFGGSRGIVPFPHHAHQIRLGDCNICHAIFPPEPDALVTLKNSGRLKKKAVMNKQCIKCHKAEAAAGNKSGPTTCSKCHRRE